MEIENSFEVLSNTENLIEGAAFPHTSPINTPNAPISPTRPKDLQVVVHDAGGFDLRQLNFAEIMRHEERNKWMSPYLHQKLQSCQRRANLSSMAKERLEN